MVLEIAAGRLIAPYVGVSLYTWTSIIGVILGGLSLGNWLGGVWADRGAGPRQAGIILMAAGLACLMVLFLLTLVASVIQQQNISLLSASFLYVASLFFLPAVLIGIITPLLTTLALKLNPQTGHIVGMLHALAALGSIVGTFITGYWLVQYIGTYTVITACGLLFFLLAIPFIRRQSLLVVTVLTLLSTGTVFLTHQRQGFTSPCDTESQYFCIRVVNADHETPLGNATALVLDHLLHGINHTQHPGLLISPYVHAMDELIQYQLGDNAKQARYFFAGGGSYTQPRAMLARYPTSHVVVAEIDPRVTQTAEQRMGVDINQMQIHHTDARVVLQQWQGELFDVVVGDVFHDVAIPYHLTTQEYARLVKARLTPQGLYVVNIVDAHPDPLLLKTIYKTLQREFKHIDIWLEPTPKQSSRITYVISATNGDPFPETLTAQYGFTRQWQKQNDQILQQNTRLASLPILTDDFVPVERLISRLITTQAGL